MLTGPATPSYRRPSIFRAALRGAIVGPLAYLFVLAAFLTACFVAVVGFVVGVAFVLSHLPADAIPAP